MGLDMYLTQRFYVKNWDHMSDEEKHAITILKGGQPADIATDRISQVTVQEMYWRKANQIHKWFVDNVQNGVDDCGDYYVDPEQLGQLLLLVTRVLEASELEPAKIENGQVSAHDEAGNLIWKPCIEDGQAIKDASVAMALLPGESGCFFGSKDYDQYYYEQLVETQAELKRICSQESKGDFYYHSSW